MPKATYFALPEDKRQRVYQACKAEFESRSFHEATVMHIVKALDIPRGSFYQYFEDLMDCYFYVLSQETSELHQLFLDSLKAYGLPAALDHYKHSLLAQLLESPSYQLYKFRFLDWTYELDRAWAQKMRPTFHSSERDNPVMQIFKSVVHDLVYRLFAEDWDQVSFVRHYDAEMALLMSGLMAGLSGAPGHPGHPASPAQREQLDYSDQSASLAHSQDSSHSLAQL